MGELLHEEPGGVGGAVVDEDDFVGEGEGLADCRDAAVKFGQYGEFVMAGDDDGKCERDVAHAWSPYVVRRKGEAYCKGMVVAEREPVVGARL